MLSTFSFSMLMPCAKCNTHVRRHLGPLRCASQTSDFTIVFRYDLANTLIRQKHDVHLRTIAISARRRGVKKSSDVFRTAPFVVENTPLLVLRERGDGVQKRGRHHTSVGKLECSYWSTETRPRSMLFSMYCPAFSNDWKNLLHWSLRTSSCYLI